MAEKKDAPVEKKGGSKKKLYVIIGAVAIILLIGGGIGAWFLLREHPKPQEEHDASQQVPVPALKTAANIGPLVNIEEFIVNIISGDTAHYVKTSLSVELSSPEAKAEVEQRMPQMRDAIILLISSKTYEELQDLQGKKQLKAELVTRINSFLQNGKVESIYFTNFVVQ